MPKHPKIKTAIYDLETNGLLGYSDYYKWDVRFGTPRPPMNRIHCLVIRDYERKITYVFRDNGVEDTIQDGLEMLEEAEIVVGHNIVQFDNPALAMIFQDVCFQGIVYDTLPMCRMIFADQKDKDFRLAERGALPGALIGSHTLDAWGHRLGLHKGDYVKDCEAKGMDPWESWNQEMEDYCVQDVAVSVLLYERCLRMDWAKSAIIMEHEIHDLMGRQERNGIHFNVDLAKALERALREETVKLEFKLIEHFGKWWAPEKKRIVKQQWEWPEGFVPEKPPTYKDIRPEHGEDMSRAVWAEVTVPKGNRKLKDKLHPGCLIHYNNDAPYCKIDWKEFNPGSRQQIVERFTTVYNWHPVDFTEAGRPEVSDDVLRTLGDAIPMAIPLAELFYYNKRLGQLADGKNGWLKKVSPEGKIHHYCNTGGTISGRASHIGPNLGQVPRVVFVPVTDEKGEVVLKANGKPEMRIGKGREGDHGWDCRRLFYVPEPWWMVGADLEGIELRCFGEQLAKYDGGAYLELVLSGDIHTYNQNVAGLPTRDHAKTFIYALIYGAGDIKLGSIVDPLLDEEEQRRIGKELRNRFMSGIPAFARLVADIQRQAKLGFIPGLDGRKLWVRSKHAALNTKLQSDAALIAKKWVLLTEQILEEPEQFRPFLSQIEVEIPPLKHGWDGDFAHLLWIHDEEQLAVRDHVPEVMKITEGAAGLAGKFFGYGCPIAAKAKKGHTWADTH